MNASSERTSTIRSRLTLAIGLGWKPARATVLLMAATSSTQGFVPIAYALLTRLIINALVAHQANQTIVGIVGLAITTAVLMIIAPLTRFASAELNRKLEVTVQAELFGSIGQLNDLRLLENPKFLDRLRLAQQAGLNAPAQVIAGCLATVQSAITLGGFIITLALLDPWIALLLVGSGVPAIFAELELGSSRAAMRLRVSPFRRRVLGYVSLLVDANAAQEVQAFGLAGFLRERLLIAIGHATQEERAQDRHEVRTRTLLAAIAAAVGAAGLSLVVIGALNRQFNAGDVAIVLAALSSLQLSLPGVVNQLGLMTESLRLLDHYRAVVDGAFLESDLVPSGTRQESRTVARLHQSIEFRDVWFRYDETQPWVLQEVNLTVPHDATVALVGPNGSGKSTIVKLLCRFYEPSRGAILWDGVDIRELPLVAFRHRVSLILQDSIIYDLSAAENIGIGKLESLNDRRAIQRAADAAEAHELIARLPHGYDTLLSRIFFNEGSDEIGVTLSAGQSQRLAIARALMRTDADLLILDEPTSALDAQAEHDLNARLKHMRGGRAALLISHRLSTTRTASAIVVMNHGRVVELGSHHELLAAGGLYAELFQLQAAGYADRTLPLRAT